MTIDHPRPSRRIQRINRWIARFVPDPSSEAGTQGEPPLPADWSVHTAGDFGIALLHASGGIHLRSLFDLKLGRELLAAQPAPLFTLGLHSGTHELLIDANTGWGQTHVQRTHRGFSLEWSHPLEVQLGPLRVRLIAFSDARRHAWRWKLVADNAGAAWSVWRVLFPQVALRRFDEKPVVLVPSGPGELKRGAWDEEYRYQQPYGQAWCTMQFMAAYGESPRSTGLYLGVHDPNGSTKDLSAVSEPAGGSVTLTVDIPAPEMVRPGNGFAFSGEAVWQLLRGDWYDVARIYKGWASEHARWWPRQLLGVDGRADTPLWTRELCAWVQSGFESDPTNGSAPGARLGPALRFREWADVPVALHWYGWHQIPFDNDYPHYFPAKDGFAEAVSELQHAGLYIMPYINGRLWDTRDRGSEDFEFTQLALPAATKDENGQPYVESYGSKEADGSPVQLAVMCPATPLWKDRVHDIVMQLIREIGVDSVYVDQVAAARPTLCVDESHGHPLGGGWWWNEGYWAMIDRIQAGLPDGRMLTTECNAEAFIPQFDAYLTWHWQHDGMVPAWPAIYGGTIQTFGRAYGGDALAQRMKAGQQLVFGEQIGWFAPTIIDDPAMAEYLRRIIRARWQLRRYFYAGEMLRPPQLGGEIAKVRADWQWQGECWVTTDAVQTGAWALPRERKLALLFANVSDETVVHELDFDAVTYDIDAAELQCVVRDESAEQLPAQTLPARFRRTLTLTPRQVMAWELSWV